MIRLICLFICMAPPVLAEMVVPVRTLPAQTVITAGDVILRDGSADGVIADPDAVIGLETRIALFAGRPIRLSDVGTPAVVDRNQILPLIYNRGGLVIATDGRALDRAGPGEVIRVMNIASRSTVTARIGADGAAYVTN